jgi:hypothetical protein
MGFGEDGDLALAYQGPITVDTSTQIRARAFLFGALEGPIRTEAYFKLEQDAAEATSNLPIVLLDSFGDSPVPVVFLTERLPMMMEITGGYIFKKDFFTGSGELNFNIQNMANEPEGFSS